MRPMRMFSMAGGFELINAASSADLFAKSGVGGAQDKKGHGGGDVRKVVHGNWVFVTGPFCANALSR